MMGFCLVSGHDFIADFQWKWDVDEPVTVSVTEFSPTDAELEAAVLMRTSLHIRELTHEVANLALCSWHAFHIQSLYQRASNNGH
jgi:hypothetical protein